MDNKQEVKLFDKMRPVFAFYGAIKLIPICLKLGDTFLLRKLEMTEKTNVLKLKAGQKVDVTGAETFARNVFHRG